MYMTQLIVLYGTIHQIWLFKNIADNVQFSTFFKTKAKQGKINVCFNFTLLIYIVNLNAREILVTKMATKPQFLVTKEKMLVALVTISVIVSSHAKTNQL